jgi:transposase-like protein
MSEFYCTTHEEAKFRSDTENSKMVGASVVPARTRCGSCEVMRTTKTGKFRKSGRFVCHHCSKTKAKSAA